MDTSLSGPAFGVNAEENLSFTIIVHVATVCSTLVILWKEIDWIFRGLFKFEMNERDPLCGQHSGLDDSGRAIVGLFQGLCRRDFRIRIVHRGFMLLLTAALLTFSYYYKPRQKEKISVKDAFVIGIAQACAVMPGLSRSGSTIATGLLLGREQ